MDDELDLTELLGRAQAGDTAAAEAVFRATYVGSAGRWSICPQTRRDSGS